MAGMTVPSQENPFSVGVEISKPSQPMGIVEMHENPYSTKNQILALGQSASAYNQAQDKWDQKVNQTRVQDFANQLEAERLRLRDDPKTGYLQQKGQNALEGHGENGLMGEVQDAFRAKYDELYKQAGNPMIKAQLDSLYKAQSLKLTQGVNEHIIRQQAAYAQAVDKKTLDMAALKAVSDDPTESKSGFDVLRAYAQRKAQEDGVPVDYSTTVGVAHTAKIQQLVELGKISQARTYLKSAKGSDEMSTKQILAAQKSIKAGAQKAAAAYQAKVAMDLATKAAAKLDPNSDTPIADRNAAFAELEKIKDPKQRHQAEYQLAKLLKEQDDKNKRVWAEQYESVKSWVDQGVPIPDEAMDEMVRSHNPIAKKLSAAQLKHEENLIKEARKDKVVTDEAMAADFATIYRTDPSRYVEMASDPTNRPYFSLKDWNAIQKRAEVLKAKGGKAFLDKVDVQLRATGVTDSKKRKRILDAAADAYALEQTQATKDGYVPEDRQKEMVSELFKKEGFFAPIGGGSRHYQSIVDNGGSAYAAAPGGDNIQRSGWSAAANKPDETGRPWVQRIYEANGGDFQNATKLQKQILNKYKASGYMPPWLFKTMYDFYYEKKKSRPNNRQVMDLCIKAVVSGKADQLEKALKK